MIDVLVVLVVLAFVFFDARIRTRVLAMLGATIGVRPPVPDDDPAQADDDPPPQDADPAPPDGNLVSVDDTTLDVLARLVASGAISAAQACTIGLGVTQRGNNPVYRAIRERAEQIKRGATGRDAIVGLDDKGRVIRRDVDGRAYTVDPQTRERVYVG